MRTTPGGRRRERYEVSLEHVEMLSVTSLRLHVGMNEHEVECAWNLRCAAFIYLCIAILAHSQRQPCGALAVLDLSCWLMHAMESCSLA